LGAFDDKFGDGSAMVLFHVGIASFKPNSQQDRYGGDEQGQ
jgi:hypothetical protein